VSEYFLLFILLLSSCFGRIISTYDEILAAKHTHTHTQHRFENLEVALEVFLEFFPSSRKWS
jgi:hypothetical protein